MGGAAMVTGLGCGDVVAAGVLLVLVAMDAIPGSICDMF